MGGLFFLASTWNILLFFFQCMKIFRVFSHIIAVLIPVLLLCMSLSYTVISQQNVGRIFDKTRQLPYSKVGLLLGTSPRTRKGTASEFFQNRITAAITLYKRGRIDYILASGDNGSIHYNEPIYMQQELVRLGVPPERIVLDYAGFSTLDSVIRARKIFGQEQFTVISQRFHNERALYIARAKGINAFAYNAGAVGGYAGARVLAREVLARVKAVLDVNVFKRAPKFLGNRESIPQD